MSWWSPRPIPLFKRRREIEVATHSAAELEARASRLISGSIIFVDDAGGEVDLHLDRFEQALE